MGAKLNPRHYYQFNPAGEHATGDIWSQLPTNGLLRSSLCSGLVITPACDLANQKVETITYLPIVSFLDYCSTQAFYPEVRLALAGLLPHLKLGELPELLPEFGVPDGDVITEIEKTLSGLDPKRTSEKEKGYADRCFAGIRHLRKLQSKERVPATPADLEMLFGDKTWHTFRMRAVRNSFRSDLHFLPADGEHRDWSAVPDHGVVLFRYPLTSPLAAFDMAQDTTIGDWAAAITRMEDAEPGIRQFARARPLKVLTLQKEFLSDLLTRFVSLYVRIGSRDFTSDTVQQLCDEINNGALP